MSRQDAEVWPWLLAAGVVGGGVLVALAASQRGSVATFVSPKGNALPPGQKAEGYSTLDVEAAARMLASENPRGSERLHIEQIWTQLRSRKRGQSLFDRITAGSGWGAQGKRVPPGRTRPVSTAESASERLRALADSVLRGARPSIVPEARKFFEPEQQDRAFAAAEAARNKRAAGGALTAKETRLLGYHRDANQIRAEWLKSSRYLDTIDGVEFYT